MRPPAAPLPLAALALVAALALAGCAPSEDEAAFHAKKALLERQNQGIRELLDEAEQGTLVPVGEFLVGIDEKIVGDLLRFALPIEKPLGKNHLLRVEKADVLFRDKYGIVTVDGVVVRRDKPGRRIAVRAHGGLDKVAIDSANDRLSLEIAIDDVEILEAGILEGVLGRGGKKLVATKGKELLDDALPTIQVPVGLSRGIRVPPIHEGPITLDSLNVPIDLSVKRVVAANRKLWVTVDANVGEITGAEEGLGVTVAKKRKGAGK